MTTLSGLKVILKDTLQLGKRADRLDESTVLFGGIPELDSFAILTVVPAIEARFGIAIEDDEINAEIFESIGSLCAFIDNKIAAS